MTNSPFAPPPPLDAAQLPRGFRFASTACSLKKSGRPDLALIASEGAATAAGVFTTNRAAAAPVVLSRRHLRASAGAIRAIVANSGNANCATGASGMKAAESTARMVAGALRCRPDQVLVCSTGVIGMALKVERILDAIPGLAAAAEASPAAFAGTAGAIMTTDKRPKWSAASCRIGGKAVSVAGCAKGAGMIHPNMATLLAFVLTDAVLSPQLAQMALHEVTSQTFNSITVDGDTSTNDTLLLLASGAAGHRPLAAGTADCRRFAVALEAVCQELAVRIVADGEGATRVAEIEVRGAPSDALAVAVANTVATSPLVKTALAGADPNWGRILAAVGRTLSPRPSAVDVSRLEIRLAGEVVCRRGQMYPFAEDVVHRRMLEQIVPVTIDLKKGRGRARVWTSDFTAEYVRINASYRS